MGIKKYKPTTPSRRFLTVLTYDEITKDRPEKSLVEIKKKNSGIDPPNQFRCTNRVHSASFSCFRAEGMFSLLGTVRPIKGKGRCEGRVNVDRKMASGRPPFVGVS